VLLAHRVHVPVVKRVHELVTQGTMRVGRDELAPGVVVHAGRVRLREQAGGVAVRRDDDQDAASGPDARRRRGEQALIEVGREVGQHPAHVPVRGFVKGAGVDQTPLLVGLEPVPPGIEALPPSPQVSPGELLVGGLARGHDGPENRMLTQAAQIRVPPHVAEVVEPRLDGTEEVGGGAIRVAAQRFGAGGVVEINRLAAERAGGTGLERPWITPGPQTSQCRRGEHCRTPQSGQLVHLCLRASGLHFECSPDSDAGNSYIGADRILTWSPSS
jgi:hypothetical protein